MTDTTIRRSYPVEKSEEQWRQELSKQEYSILRNGSTEIPFTGEYTDKTKDGTYICKACGHELFTSDEQFHSGSGWASFYAEAQGANIELNTDTSWGMTRTEATCSNCGSHLGHVFYGEPYGNPVNVRYCINSASLDLVKKK